MNLKTTSNFHYLTYYNCFLKHIKQPLKISYISFDDAEMFTSEIHDPCVRTAGA